MTDPKLPPVEKQKSKVGANLVELIKKFTPQTLLNFFGKVRYDVLDAFAPELHRETIIQQPKNQEDSGGLPQVSKEEELKVLEAEQQLRQEELEKLAIAKQMLKEPGTALPTNGATETPEVAAEVYATPERPLANEEIVADAMDKKQDDFALKLDKENPSLTTLGELQVNQIQEIISLVPDLLANRNSEAVVTNGKLEKFSTKQEIMIHVANILNILEKELEGYRKLLRESEKNSIIAQGIITEIESNIEEIDAKFESSEKINVDDLEWLSKKLFPLGFVVTKDETIILNSSFSSTNFLQFFSDLVPGFSSGRFNLDDPFHPENKREFDFDISVSLLSEEELNGREVIEKEVENPRQLFFEVQRMNLKDYSSVIFKVGDEYLEVTKFDAQDNV